MYFEKPISHFHSFKIIFEAEGFCKYVIDKVILAFHVQTVGNGAFQNNLFENS